MTFLSKPLIILYIISVFGYSCDLNSKISIEDNNGVLSKTNAPVSINIQLNENQILAAKEGRLGLFDPLTKNMFPVQLEREKDGTNYSITFIAPDKEAGMHNFNLIENKIPFETNMNTSLSKESGQLTIDEAGKKVLQYNYQTVYEKDVIRHDDEKLEEHTRTQKDTFVTTSKYAVPRSNYIHPLYGLEGEMLTRDWPEGGHPHHRAIFWAWPEVKYGTELGDIYALQRVFARPTGNIKYTSGPVYAQIMAENLWMWEDREPIVREHALINIYRSSPVTRVIDLSIKLDALQDSITIATRDTDSYGGLNIRMQTPQYQEITYHSDVPDSNPIRAWSDFNGIFEGSESASGLMVLQHMDNPEYPGKWVEYPNLAWVQPTFPSPGTRYPLSMDESLVLRYRLIVHEGGKPSRDISEKSWDAYHAASTPKYFNE